MNDIVDSRLSAMEALLERAGVNGARVSVAGHTNDIAVIEAPTTPAVLMPLVREIRALGFRYVTLELVDKTHG